MCHKKKERIYMNKGKAHHALFSLSFRFSVKYSFVILPLLLQLLLLTVHLFLGMGQRASFAFHGYYQTSTSWHNWNTIVIHYSQLSKSWHAIFWKDNIKRCLWETHILQCRHWWKCLKTCIRENHFKKMHTLEYHNV